jgi:ABC-type branched-subunit amino acid transport system permease subunit
MRPGAGLWRMAWGLLPLGIVLVSRDRFTLSIFAVASTQALYVLSWDVLGGLSGRISLGHALPFGCGAYATALVSGWGLVPPAPAIAVGALTGIAAGALQGAFGARLPRIGLAIVTLAIAECAHEIAGMLQIPGPGGLVIGEEAGVTATVFPADETAAARLAAAALAVAVIGVLWMVGSRLGLAMRTLEADDRGATASGIDVTRIREVAFVIAGGLAGLAGGLAASLAGRAAPPMLSLEPSLFALAAAGIGGRGSIVGPALTAFAASAALQWFDLPAMARLALYALVLIGMELTASGRRRDACAFTAGDGAR